MGEIQWTDRTWNPVRGCSPVSPGCANCYAARQAARFTKEGAPYAGLALATRAGPVWTGRVDFVADRLGDPLHWRKPQRVFVNSMSDLFHEELHDEEIAAIFGVMAMCPRHTFQALTKRSKRMREWFVWVTKDRVPKAWCIGAAFRAMGEEPVLFADPTGCGDPREWPLRNVRLGVSVENQATADERIPDLLATPAAVRWVSYEPALGPVDFDLPRCDCCLNASDSVADDGATPWCSEHDNECSFGHWLDPLNGGLAWIIVGGESGPRARPFDLTWARDTVVACREAGVPCFVKQLGTKPIGDWGEPSTSNSPFLGTDGCWHLHDKKGGDPSEWPEDLRVREWPGEVTRV